MKIQVKAVEGNTQKSKAEIEEQLLQKHNAQQGSEPVDEKPEKVEASAVEKETKVEETPPIEDKTPSSELSDENVLNFIPHHSARKEKKILSKDWLGTFRKKLFLTLKSHGQRKRKRKKIRRTKKILRKRFHLKTGKGPGEKRIFPN